MKKPFYYDASKAKSLIRTLRKKEFIKLRDLQEGIKASSKGNYPKELYAPYAGPTNKERINRVLHTAIAAFVILVVILIIEFNYPGFIS